MPIEDKAFALRVRKTIARITPCDITRLEFAARGGTIYITGILSKPPGMREQFDVKAELDKIEEACKRMAGVHDVIISQVRFR